nr:HAD family hydrolase [uncultured Sellimonas sp.]
MSIVFFDIDGTFLSDLTREIPNSAKKAVKMLQKQGHKAFINTGRTYVSLPDEIKACGFDGYVCGCGTHIYYKNQKLCESKLSVEICIKTIETMRKFGIPAVYEEEQAIYFEKSYEAEQDKVDPVKKVMEKRNIAKIIPEDIRKSPILFDKVFVFLPKNEYGIKAKEYLDTYFHCIDRGKNAFEVIQKNHTKGTGVRFVCHYLQENPEESYAFGDSMNDLDMLKETKHAVAMGVCDERILPFCEFQTDQVEEDGIYKALKKYRLI